MTFLAYLLSAVLAFSGVIVGTLLAINTKEEMPTAKKYLPWMQKILFIAIIAAFLNYFKFGIIIKLVIYAIVIFTVLKSKTLSNYVFLAVIFFLLGQRSESLFIISTLVFLYGFPTGSLFVISNKKAAWLELVKKVMLKYGIFLIVSIGLQLLYSIFILKKF